VNLLREYIRALLAETSNKDFIDELMPIYTEWEELQSRYGPVHKGVWVNPETGEAHYPEGQSIPIEDQPDYVKDASKYYGQQSDHPATRRTTFSQTQAEVDIEKKVLRLFQKYGDQSFFQGITIYHDLNYPAASLKPFISTGLEYSDFNRTDYFDMEAGRHKDVMSCHGSVDGKIRGSYGMILKGHVVFASRADLASQTLRTAHKKVKEKHRGSGLPKRASPRKIHPSERDIEKSLERNKRMRDFEIRRGRDAREELDRDKVIEMLNTVVLNAQDVRDNHIEEILLDNWTIEGWFYSGQHGGVWPEKFWQKGYESGIEKPVYSVLPTGEKTEVDLEVFFGEVRNGPTS